MANSQKNRSKCKRFWKYGSETTEQARARRYATKAAARRRKRKLRYARPNETPELRAARAQRAKKAALQLFKKWLETRRVTEFAARPGYYDLVFWVRQGLPDILPEG